MARRIRQHAERFYTGHDLGGGDGPATLEDYGCLQLGLAGLLSRRTPRAYGEPDRSQSMGFNDRE